MDLVEVATIAAAILLVHALAYYALSQLRRDMSVVDIGWGLGIASVAVVLIGRIGERATIQHVAMLVVAAWGVRLGLHVLTRQVSQSEEDWRYKNWRNEWGGDVWWRSLLQVFLLQGFLQLIMSAAIIIAAASPVADIPKGLPVVSMVGLALWVIGFYFEAVGDWQLRRFINHKKRATVRKKRSRGKRAQATIMKKGLWRYTRHPNYFGEVTQWWGVFLIVLPLPNGWLAIFSTLLITYLLLRVSGIPMLEKKYDNNKEYQRYKKRTSAFIPLPPKS